MRNHPGQPASKDLFDRLADAARAVGSVALVAAIVSRGLFPSEDAAEGSGTYFLPLSLVVGICLVAERVLGVRGPKLLTPVLAWSGLIVGWGIAAYHADYAYPAINMLWEWIGVAILSIYAWHRGATAGSNLLASTMILLCLTQALLAGYESLISIPRLRAMYERNDPALVEAMRGLGVERGSKLEESFKHRLYSTEPLGTTGHPNTLAGLLVLGLPIVAVMVRSSFLTHFSRWAPVSIALIIVSAILSALLMSKSRSAWIALLPMALCWWWLDRRRQSPSPLRWDYLAAGFALLGILAVVLVGAGILDREIISQAGKSLSYRWEWWQASWQVIARNPWWGVGPGNFRNHYLEFKLPFSSEEISDPHQFMIELAATGGILCLTAYLALSLVTMLAAIRPAERTPVCTSIGLGIEGWLGVLIGVACVALLEVGLVPLIARPQEHPALLAAIVATAMVSLLGWVGGRWTDESLRPAIVAGSVGLHIHYLTAGGVAFPTLMITSWVLLSSAAGSVDQVRRSSLIGPTIAIITLAVGTFLFVFQQFAPRLERDLLAARARTMEERINKVWSPSDPEVRPELWARLVSEFRIWTEVLREAADKLPADREGWDRLAMAETTFMRLLARLRSPEEEQSYRRALKAWEEVLRLDPRRSISYARRGMLFEEAGASRLDPDGLIRAEEDFAKAASLYPNSAFRQWQWGSLLQGLGRSEEGLARFRRALELDQTPHLDKKLTEPQRQWAKAYIENNQRFTRPQDKN
jgi:hypothetical protein